jgi:putative transport protein
MNEATDQILALFVVIGLGLTLGKISWRGVSLGASGVIFVALAAGHFGFQIPKMAGDMGMVLFVYCLGIGAGPGFLRVFLRQGKALAVMGVAMNLSATAVAWLGAKVLGWEPDLASGLLAGALTSTPALAAASERLPGGSELAVGFGVAYPFGVIGVIVFVQITLRLFHQSVSAAERDHAVATGDDPIVRMLVEVLNPSVVGKELSDIAVISHSNCQVSRLLVGEKLEPIPPSFTLGLRQRVLIVGRRSRISDAVDVLGKTCDDIGYTLDVEQQRRRIVVTSKSLIGQTLEQLHFRSRFGATVTRIARHDIEFVPSPQEKLQFSDALTVVGERDALDRLAKYAGHREQSLDETDLISLATGLVFGVLLGSVEFSYGGGSISLGLAGGPLVVGLLLGHFGRIGPIVGYMPRAARWLCAEVGLALFLAHAGSQAGSEFVSVVSQHGLQLGAGAVAILAVPLAVGFLMARYVLRIGILEMLGGICGAMTSTPGLGVVTSQVATSSPATSYAAVYPVALIIITLLTTALISLLQ